MTERMTADEARALLAGMTPGTLSVERAAGIRRLAVPQGDELALVIRDSPREFGGAMYSLEVCRGMDGPTREANAAAFAAVKRALATVAATAPDDTRAQAAGECDVAAIGARAAIGWRLALRCGDEIAVDVTNAFDGTPLADCTAAEQLDYMRATARLHEGAAPATAEGRCDGNVDGDSVVGYVAAELLMRKYDVAEILAPGEASRAALLRHIAAEPARVAAAVAGERARVAALRDAATDLAETLSRREDACRASAKDSLSGEIRSRLLGKTSAYGHAAELLTRVLIDADAPAAPAQGVG